MSQNLFILVLIIGVFIALIILEFYSRFKMKQAVREKWGKMPYQPRFDQEESLKTAWQIQKKGQNWDSEIDDLTWYDLDMFKVFQSINNTFSSIGSEALYAQLRHFNFKKDQQLATLIDFFADNTEVRQAMQYQFARLGKKDKNFTRQYLEGDTSQVIGSLPVYILLGLLPFIGLAMLMLGQMAGIYLTVISLVFNLIFYQYKKMNLETELTSMQYLVSTVVTAKKIAKYQSPIQDKLQKNLKCIQSIPRFGFSFRAKSGSETELLFDYLNIFLMLPFISYQFVISKLAKYRTEAKTVWDLLGQIEVAIAILNYRAYMPITCEPAFASGGVIAVDNYHPLLDHPVANPIEWTETTLVTGSNASGKSTYVKSVALSCILAQTIQTAIASQFQMQPGHVYTSMAVEDNLFAGDSYFVAEIKSIKRLLAQVESGERCYCFIDEILKGTNTIERIASSSAIINWLMGFPSLAFVATHDIELTEILKDRCDNIHFSEKVSREQGVAFDYQLHHGPARSRNAIALLQAMDYPASIVSHAQKSANDFDQAHKWSKISKIES